MSKRTILWLSVGTIVAFIIGFVLVMNESGIGVVLTLGAGLVWMVPWVAAVIKVAKIQRWGWVIGLLLTGILGTVVYGIWGPEDQYA